MHFLEITNFDTMGIENYLPKRYMKKLGDFSEVYEFKKYKQILIYLFCFKICITYSIYHRKILRISHNDDNSLWFSRDLTKSHVITSLYNSTSYGRRQLYLEYILIEFVQFIDYVIHFYLITECSLAKIHKFTNEICNDKPIVINNQFFTITLNSLVTDKIQVRRSSITGGNTSQLVIKKLTNKFNSEKLRFMMFLANLTHSFDG
jgi:hypothetical protein